MQYIHTQSVLVLLIPIFSFLFFKFTLSADQDKLILPLLTYPDTVLQSLFNSCLEIEEDLSLISHFVACSIARTVHVHIFSTQHSYLVTLATGLFICILSFIVNVSPTVLRLSPTFNTHVICFAPIWCLTLTFRCRPISYVQDTSSWYVLPPFFQMVNPSQTSSLVWMDGRPISYV